MARDNYSFNKRQKELAKKKKKEEKRQSKLDKKKHAGQGGSRTDFGVKTKIFTETKRGVTWDINKVVVVDTVVDTAVDSAEVRRRCTKRLALNVKRNAKFLLNPEVTVRYTARIAFQSARTTAVKNEINGYDSRI